MRKSRKKFVDSKIMKNAIKDSFKKLNPKEMIKNPVMFVAYVGMIITAILTISPKIAGEEGHLYNGIVTFILFLTVMFANFAESIAEGRGKAQADSLKNTKKDTKAKRVLDKLGN